MPTFLKGNLLTAAEDLCPRSPRPCPSYAQTPHAGPYHPANVPSATALRAGASTPPPPARELTGHSREHVSRRLPAPGRTPPAVPGPVLFSHHEASEALDALGVRGGDVRATASPARGPGGGGGGRGPRAWGRAQRPPAPAAPAPGPEEALVCGYVVEAGRVGVGDGRQAGRVQGQQRVEAVRVDIQPRAGRARGAPSARRPRPQLPLLHV